MCKQYIHQLALTPPQLGTQACTLIGNRTRDLSGCRPVLNPLSHTRQGYYFLNRIKKEILVATIKIPDFTFKSDSLDAVDKAADPAAALRHGVAALG